MGLLSAGLTTFYIRDTSILNSLPDLPTIPRFPSPRAFVSGSTVFFGLVCLIVILVLAYVTNPSESSFRTFLTEQAFRRHLHKLQDEDSYGDEESLEYEPSYAQNRNRKGKRFGPPRSNLSKPRLKAPLRSSDPQANHYSRPPRFHFSNHLGINLQTPSHVFKSYGLCTIAVTQQVDTASSYTCATKSTRSHRAGNGHSVSNPRTQNGHPPHPGHVENGDGQNARIRGTWYIGAFGRWWIGGELAFLKEDLVQSIASTASSVDGEVDKSRGELKSGQYEVKVLDQVDAFAGLPIKSDTTNSSPTTPQSATIPPASSSAPKTRSRASTRSVKQTVTPQPSRGSTPPPAAARAHITITTPNGQKASGNSPVSPKQDSSKRKSKSRSNSNVAQLNAQVPEEPNQPPDVVDTMKEIAKSQAAVQDLRDQLSSFQQQALASHAALRLTLDEHRTRKKQDDATRTDLKSRMKTLEESKRHADTGKRDAERKLKTAETARDLAINRMQRLVGETEAMKKKMESGEGRMQKSKEEVIKAEEESNGEMEKKRSEIKGLEESIAALGVKAKELEETLASEKERLATLRTEVDEKKQRYQQQQQQASLTLALQQQQQQQRAAGPLGSGVIGMEDTSLGSIGAEQQAQTWSGTGPGQGHTHNISPAILSAFNPFEHSNPYSSHHPRRPSAEMVPLVDGSQTLAGTQSRIRSVSLGELSSMTQSAMAVARETQQPKLSPGDEGFFPCDVDDRKQLHTNNPSYPSLNVSTTGLLPSNLVNSIETETPISTSTPSNAVNIRESRWRTGMWPWRSDSLSKSTPPSGTGSGGKGFDPFDSKRPSFKPAPIPDAEANNASEVAKPAPPSGRRWFSRSTTATMSDPSKSIDPSFQISSAPEGTSAASKSRLNPDAKAFSLPKGRNLLGAGLWTPVGMTMPPPANVHPGPLHLLSPPSDGPASSFSSGSSPPVPTPGSGAMSTMAAPATKPRFRGLFSSPFAPSPAEREALQRALEKNLSHDRISVASDGSGEGSNMRLPPSPFGLPPPNPSLFNVDEEEGDAGWGSVLKSDRGKKEAIGER